MMEFGPLRGCAEAKQPGQMEAARGEVLSNHNAAANQTVTHTLQILLNSGIRCFEKVYLLSFAEDTSLWTQKLANMAVQRVLLAAVLMVQPTHSKELFRFPWVWEIGKGS